jgi:phosphohistidine swiveling domain-containing protein
MYEFITNLENPIIRRSAIVLLVVLGIPVIVGVLLAQTLYETGMSIVENVKKHIITVRPKLMELIDYIKETW